MKLICATAVAVVLFSAGCKNTARNFIKENTLFAEAQTEIMLQKAGVPDGKNYPRTLKNDGTLRVTGMYEWTSGFFPGSLWYLYELTGDGKWKSEAEKWTGSLEPLKTHTGTHDLGFMMYCSYGNAERLAPKPEYRDILIESANSLASRFSDKTRTIKSWNRFKPWDDAYESEFPVIIDNMMNLEMLFYASRLTGDRKYYDIAVTHAESTLENHFRDDFTTYHVVAYDTLSGKAVHKSTAQGYSDNSTWSRGQAWAIYGFTMTYRETEDPKFLDAALKATAAYLKNLPEDLVPLWDFNAGEEGYTPGGRSYALEHPSIGQRDASAAAITCSALFELGALTSNGDYIRTAEKMLRSLASPAYRALPGTDEGFLLTHCTGSVPHKAEIDKPLVYADYYFLESLLRYRDLSGLGR